MKQKVLKIVLVIFVCVIFVLGLFSTTAASASNSTPPPSQPQTTAPSSRASAQQSYDWLYDITIAAIGAFIGYGFALLLEQRLLLRRRKKCIENIVIELKDIELSVKEKADDRSIPSALSYNLYFPIWETVVGNGDILELKKEPYYDELFAMYNTLSKLARLEDGTRNSDSQNIEEIIGMRQAVLDLYKGDLLKELIQKY